MIVAVGSRFAIGQSHQGEAPVPKEVRAPAQELGELVAEERYHEISVNEASAAINPIFTREFVARLSLDFTKDIALPRDIIIPVNDGSVSCTLSTDKTIAVKDIDWASGKETTFKIPGCPKGAHSCDQTTVRDSTLILWSGGSRIALYCPQNGANSGVKAGNLFDQLNLAQINNALKAEKIGTLKFYNRIPNPGYPDYKAMMERLGSSNRNGTWVEKRELSPSELRLRGQGQKEDQR